MDEIRAGDHVGMVEPFVGQQGVPGHILEHMLGQDQGIAAEIVFKGGQRGGILGFHGQGLVVHHPDAFDGFGVGLNDALVADDDVDETAASALRLILQVSAHYSGFMLV